MTAAGFHEFIMSKRFLTSLNDVDRVVREETEVFACSYTIPIMGGLHLEIWHPKELINTDTGCFYYIEPGNIRLDTTGPESGFSDHPRGGNFIHEDRERGVTFVATHDMLTDTESLVRAIKRPGQVIVMFNINSSHVKIYNSLKIAPHQGVEHRTFLECWKPITVLSTDPGVSSVVLTSDCRIIEIEEQF